MKDFKDVTNIVVGGIVCIVGGFIYKKLKDIHEEIIYFEDRKNVWMSKKEFDKACKKVWKKRLSPKQGLFLFARVKNTLYYERMVY